MNLRAFIHETRCFQLREVSESHIDMHKAVTYGRDVGYNEVNNSHYGYTVDDVNGGPNTCSTLTYP